MFSALKQVRTGNLCLFCNFTGRDGRDAGLRGKIIATFYFVFSSTIYISSRVLELRNYREATGLQAAESPTTNFKSFSSLHICE